MTSHELGRALANGLGALVVTLGVAYIAEHVVERTRAMRWARRERARRAKL